MPLQLSGQISIQNLITECGGTGKLSEYYRGGALVPDRAENSAVPTSGVISLSNFYGCNCAPGGGGGGGGCCFTGNTLITMADNTTKQIDQLQVGDQVLSYNFDTGAHESNYVSEVIVRSNRYTHRYILSNGTNVEATNDHPLYVIGKGYSSLNPEMTKQGYTQIGDVALIEVGDNLMDINGNPVQILEIKAINYPYELYTFNNTNKTSPNFYANNILTY